MTVTEFIFECAGPTLSRGRALISFGGGGIFFLQNGRNNKIFKFEAFFVKSLKRFENELHRDRVRAETNRKHLYDRKNSLKPKSLNFIVH